MEKRTIVLIVIGLLLVGAVYFALEDRIRRLERRVENAESALRTLEPIRRIMSGFRPEAGGRPDDMYGPVQATGEPNSGVEGKDSPFAWCPGQEDAGEEWLQLEFGKAVEAIGINVHSNWNPGAVVKVLAVGEDGAETELWSTEGVEESAGAVQEIRWETPQEVQSVKLVLDTAAVPGWNEIDAVGLVGSDEDVRWATGATASSSWSSGPVASEAAEENPE